MKTISKRDYQKLVKNFDYLPIVSIENINVGSLITCAAFSCSCVGEITKIKGNYIDVAHVRGPTMSCYGEIDSVYALYKILVSSVSFHNPIEQFMRKQLQE